MSRVLNWFLGLFDDLDLGETSSLVAAVAVVVSLVHHGVAYDWLGLAGFGLAAFAVANAMTRLAELPLFVFGVGGLAIGINSSLVAARFPGLQLNWLWVMLGGASLLFCMSSYMDESGYEHYEQVRKSLLSRFARTLRWAFVVLTIGLAAIYQDTTIVTVILSVDVGILLLWEAASKYTRPARGAVPVTT